MANDSVPAGTTLAGTYVVGNLLGEGGFGAVYEATQITLGRRVAIKVLRSDRILQSSGLERFAREARAAAALGHPHIALVTDFHTNPGEPPFFVMEHLSGRTLGAALAAEGPLPPDRVCAIIQQVLSGLEATHAIGIVHRDVKPDNVFLVTMPGVREFVKLLDFGIAKLAGEGEALTSVGAVLGTPAFMAPEQIRNVGIDARTDIYAVGATMYYALTGRKPHDAPSLTALLYAIAHEWPAPIESIAPHIDKSLAAVIGRAMHKDAAGRFASAREMRAALEPWAAGARASMPVPSHDVSTTIEAGPPMVTLGAVALPPGTAPMVSAPAPRASSSAGVIVALVVALVVLVGGGGVAGLLFYLHSRTPEVAATTPAAASPPPSAAPSTTPAGTGTVVSAAPSNAGQPSKPGQPSSAAQPAGGAQPASAPSGDAPGSAKGRPKMTGTTARFSSGRYTGITSKEARPVIDAAMPRISACHASTELEPPLHDDASFDIAIAASGSVTSVQRVPTTSQPAHARYDACVRTALSGAVFPATPKGATIRLGVVAPLPR